MRSTGTSAFVLDSWAVIAYLEGETASEKVADIISDAHSNNRKLLISVVNAAEVWYIVARETTISDADESIRQLRELGVEFIDADWEISNDAGRFKAANKMSLADAYAAALAKRRKATLVTGDYEFKAIENEISIDWLR